MNKPDCGNQRTGQPRCAQLMAKTWNCSPSTRRTQHAVSTVLPSVGVTYGLRNVASRVSPSGKSFIGPSGTHERYAFARPRVMEDRRKPTMGTARAVATNPLNSIPIFMKKPRRDSVFSFDIFILLMLGVIRSSVWLPGVLNPA